VSDLGALCSAGEGTQAVVIGPGIDRSDETAELLRLFLAQLSVPCLLDADGLNAVAGHLDVLSSAKGPLILTPHPGEMARLIGSTSTQVQQERLAVARSLATSRKLVVVLKGARTLVALPDGTVFINPTGNAGMATAGTGDVLAGICGGLLAQKLAPARAAAVAVYAHGRAGDIAAQRVGQAGLVASDLLAALGELWRRLER
jgi:NAD(P)H-hydrate epimerase